MTQEEFDKLTRDDLEKLKFVLDSNGKICVRGFGVKGDDGKTILNGSVDPTTEGVDGDFYINTTTWQIFGPKATTWGTGTNLKGQVQTVVGGSNISIDNTDPLNPVIRATGLAKDNEVVKLTGNQTIDGVKTFSGNIGIGTTTPRSFNGTKLDIIGNMLIGNAWIERASGATGLSLTSNLYFDGAWKYFENRFGTRLSLRNDDGSIVFFTSALNAGGEGALATINERLRITNTGNLLIGTSTDVASSRLTINSTTQGFLPPRMTTTQRNAISSPAEGLVVFNTSTKQFNIYNGTGWTGMVDNTTNQTIGGNKSLTGITTLAESYKSGDDVRTYTSSNNTSGFIRGGNAGYVVVAGNDSGTGDKNVYLIPGTGGNTIIETGNVGIGTTTPSEKLEIVGNIKASGKTIMAECETEGFYGPRKTLTISGIDAGYRFRDRSNKEMLRIGTAGKDVAIGLGLSLHKQYETDTSVNSFKISSRYEMSGIPHSSNGHILQALWGDNTSSPEGTGDDGGWGFEFGPHGRPYISMMGKVIRLGRSDGDVIMENNTIPSVDNTYSCGKSGNRWSAIWAANGTIQTSDRRQKTEITSSSLGLDFIDKLNPVSYKWIEGGNIVSYEEVEVEKEVQETEIITYTEETIKLIDGKYTKVIEEKTRENKVFDEVDLYNEAGEVIGKHQVPRMVTKLVKEKKEVITSTPGKRTHFGFIAQEVEEALAGTDFGGLVIDENGQYALRYDQFISPLVQAVKELKARVEYLESKIK